MHGFVQNAQPVMKTKHTYMLNFLRNSCFRRPLSMYVCFKIPLLVMGNAQPRLSKTIDNCFSLNHVCMFEKSPKPLCLSCFLDIHATKNQRKRYPCRGIVMLSWVGIAKTLTGRGFWTCLLLPWTMHAQHTYMHAQHTYMLNIHTYMVNIHTYMLRHTYVCIVCMSEVSKHVCMSPSMYVCLRP